MGAAQATLLSCGMPLADNDCLPDKIKESLLHKQEKLSKAASWPPKGQPHTRHYENAVKGRVLFPSKSFQCDSDYSGHLPPSGGMELTNHRDTSHQPAPSDLYHQNRKRLEELLAEAELERAFKASQSRGATCFPLLSARESQVLSRDPLVAKMKQCFVMQRRKREAMGLVVTHSWCCKDCAEKAAAADPRSEFWELREVLRKRQQTRASGRIKSSAVFPQAP